MKEVFILAMMLSFCHSIFVETSLAKKVDRWWHSNFACGSISVDDSSRMARWKYGRIPQSEEVIGWLAVIWHAIEHATIDVF